MQRVRSRCCWFLLSRCVKQFHKGTRVSLHQPTHCIRSERCHGDVAASRHKPRTRGYGRILAQPGMRKVARESLGCEEADGNRHRQKV